MSVKFTMTQSGVDSMLGFMDALGKLYKDRSQALNYTLEDAVQKATVYFDAETIKIARNTKTIWHMFQYTDRESGMSNAPNFAHPLWNTFSIPSGRGSYMVDFAFLEQDAMAFTPFPTQRESNVPQAILDKLKRRHVFREKAQFMEEGLTVSYHPVEAKVLFVPTQGARNNFVSSMYTTHVPSLPKIESHGGFNAWWITFWKSKGYAFIEQEFERSVKMDTGEAFDRAVAASHKTPKPMASLKVDISRYSKQLEREVTAKAEARARRNL